MSFEVHLMQNKDMKATFEHQIWAPTELINDNTVTLNQWILCMEFIAFTYELDITMGICV